MEVKKGYKQTEIGVIPEDWEVKRLGEVCTPSKSRINPTLVNDSYKCVELEHLSQETGRLLGYVDSKNQLSLKAIFQERDILFGKLRPYLKKFLFAEFEGVCSTEIWVLKPAPEIENKWLYYSIQTSKVLNAANQSTGTKMPRAEWDTVGNVSIPLPPTKVEQAVIATALSDADALISSLEKLIAKKRNIKKGAMHELLTGKKRLPGFSGKWEVKKLGNLGKFRGGSGFTTKYQGRVEGDYPFFKVSDMNNEGNATFMINSNNWISETVRKETSANTFPRHSIVFAKIGAAIFLERKKVLSRESCIDNNMMGFVLDEGCVHFKFIYYLFLNIQLGKLVSTTALPSLNGREIAELEFGIPKFKEQTAIAQVLSGMDAEIEALEKKLEKYRMIKQGMMQNLLTGKIRLV